MKVCVSSTGPDLESQVDPRFGRCSVFVIADAETMDFESLANDAAGATGGAGISAAQSVAAKGVEAVITGNVGPNAFTTLSASGIRVFTGASGTVKEAIEMSVTEHVPLEDIPNIYNVRPRENKVVRKKLFDMFFCYFKENTC